MYRLSSQLTISNNIFNKTVLALDWQLYGPVFESREAPQPKAKENTKKGTLKSLVSDQSCIHGVWGVAVGAPEAKVLQEEVFKKKTHRPRDIAINYCSWR